MNIDDLTLGQIKSLKALLFPDNEKATADPHPMFGRRCVIRTYSAGVHIGLVDYVNPLNAMEVKLTESYRLWKWTDGGLSLSAVATNGIKGGIVNKTGEVALTNVIEYIPMGQSAFETILKFVED